MKLKRHSWVFVRKDENNILYKCEKCGLLKNNRKTLGWRVLYYNDSMDRNFDEAIVINPKIQFSSRTNNCKK